MVNSVQVYLKINCSCFAAVELFQLSVSIDKLNNIKVNGGVTAVI